MCRSRRRIWDANFFWADIDAWRQWRRGESTSNMADAAPPNAPPATPRTLMSTSASLLIVSEMIDSGVTAFVCQSVELAALAKQQLDELGVAVPHRVSLAAVGPISDETPVSGYFVQRTEKAKAISHLLADGQISRPTTLWLAGALSGSRHNDAAEYIATAAIQSCDTAPNPLEC